MTKALTLLSSPREDMFISRRKNKIIKAMFVVRM